MRASAALTVERAPNEPSRPYHEGNARVCAYAPSPREATRQGKRSQDAALERFSPKPERLLEWQAWTHFA